jgi:hypothetical protein
MQYLVIVKSQGISVAKHTVEAPDGLTAINQVEPLYGEPVKIEYVSVDLEDGRKQQKMVISNWHGYTFHVRQLTEGEIRNE